MKNVVNRALVAKKKFYYLALIALVGLVFSSCQKETPEFYVSDIQGLWLEDGTQHYVRFTDEQSDNGYFYGREWDLAEDISEADLTPYGNGWFKYRIDKNELLEINKMEYGWADIPKPYIITLLTDLNLSYYNKDQKSDKFSFSKIVEP